MSLIRLLKAFLLTCTMAFTPLQLIKILCQHVAMATSHLQAEFYAIAVRLYMIGVDTSGRVNKINGMIHTLMYSDIGQVLDMLISCPPITPNGLIRVCMALDEWEQCSCCSVGCNASMKVAKQYCSRET